MKTLRHSLYTIILGGCVLTLHAQTVLFPGLEGEALQEALRAQFRPSTTLDLTAAKDTLYLVVERTDQDSVEGIYSGYRLPLPDGVDPSQFLYLNGTGINLEHVYPQSKGADEGMAGHSDMHHLFPARVAVNEARASFPFADIPDAQTKTWFRGDMSMTTIPQTDIDSYSESRDGAFEPREAVKGNIARAIFYFYTMYRDDADAADPNFFGEQRPVLCAWHLADPVDDAEMTRSSRIAHYQDGKENPFVLDCTAALRAYCPEFSGCGAEGTQTSDKTITTFLAYATEGSLVFRLTTMRALSCDIDVFDMIGRRVTQISLQSPAGTSEYTLGQSFLPGMYTLICVPTSDARRPLVTRCVIQ